MSRESILEIQRLNLEQLSHLLAFIIQTIIEKDIP